MLQQWHPGTMSFDVAITNGRYLGGHAAVHRAAVDRYRETAGRLNALKKLVSQWFQESQDGVFCRWWWLALTV